MKLVKQINLSIITLLITTLILSSCVSEKEKTMKEFNDFMVNYETTVSPLAKNMNIAYFDAASTGKNEYYKRCASLEIEMSKIHSNKESFATLKRIKDSGLITDELKKRELNVIYNSFLSNQIDEKKLEEMIQTSSTIEKKFSTFRATFNEKEYTDNQIEEILGNSTDNKELEKAWLAHKEIGNVLSEDVLNIVHMRNNVAKELGFNNYHEMKLRLDDQDPAEIEKIFFELDNLTRSTFASLKEEIDEHLATKYSVTKEELMPWHYQNRFFQEAPKIYEVDLDNYYTDKDIVKLTRDYYYGIGLEVDDILKKSDLYEREGKNQHAFCIDIDKEGDIRILCNVQSNSSWMNTMLHELGHAVYNKYIDKSLPVVLRSPAHTFSTEAIAMIFGRFASNPKWIQDNTGISEDEKNRISEDSYKILRLKQLVFSRWAQVMYHFEKDMYANPDQDLNSLWWDHVEKYQMIKRPENRNAPDWASKIHIATAPCYYHNYLLGEILASQLYFYITKNVIKSDDMRNQSFANNVEVGNYLVKNIFEPGSKWYWNTMIENATGEKLTAKYYAKQFID